ncbi:MAG: ABC transporter ATP-binding protein [Bacillota bacterium]|jgi:branched-chain amino acid transport system ATP-binding protein
MPVLKVTQLNVFYGTIHALHDVSFEVEEGEIVTLIGANGAGKTSVLHSISGLIAVHSGQVEFNGRTLTGCPADKIVAAGLVQVPEGRRLFADLTVKEHLELGAYRRKDLACVKADYEVIYSYFPRLRERLKQPAGTLSGGEQQMLAMARALMSRPRLLLLDEPSMGLAPLLVKEIFRIIREFNAAGTTILLVEQNARLALAIARRAYVLETGRIILYGPAAELAASPEVRRAYLGG